MNWKRYVAKSKVGDKIKRKREERVKVRLKVRVRPIARRRER